MLIYIILYARLGVFALLISRFSFFLFLTLFRGDLYPEFYVYIYIILATDKFFVRFAAVYLCAVEWTNGRNINNNNMKRRAFPTSGARCCTLKNWSQIIAKKLLNIELFNQDSRSKNIENDTCTHAPSHSIAQHQHQHTHTHTLSPTPFIEIVCRFFFILHQKHFLFAQRQRTKTQLLLSNRKPC